MALGYAISFVMMALALACVVLMTYGGLLAWLGVSGLMAIGVTFWVLFRSGAKR